MSARNFDVVVIGGGLVGAALAYGMRDLGPRLAVLDEGDVAHRAARGNFGLIWVQGKGFGLPAYGGFTQQSAREWPQLAAQLQAGTGIDVALRQPGGLHVCLSQEELAARAARMSELFAQPGFERHDLEVLDRAGVAARLPHVGPDVVGGTWCAQDGDCNPLRLLSALHAALARSRVAMLPMHAVTDIAPGSQAFRLRTARGELACERIVLAAGLGNARLAPMVGLATPVIPNQGQIIVTERVAPCLPFPCDTLRQTDEGTIMIGDAQQDIGFDETLGTDVLAVMASRAVRALPLLRDVRVTRAWAALRVMSPDGFPIYAESAAYPGAFVATCHSGVTLAAMHARVLGPALAKGGLPGQCRPFSADRFDVRAAA